VGGDKVATLGDRQERKKKFREELQIVRLIRVERGATTLTILEEGPKAYGARPREKAGGLALVPTQNCWWERKKTPKGVRRLCAIFPGGILNRDTRPRVPVSRSKRWGQGEKGWGHLLEAYQD